MLVTGALIVLAWLGFQDSSRSQPVVPPTPVGQIDAAAAQPITVSDIPSLYAAVVTKRLLQQKAANMNRTFPATAAGTAVAMVATLVPYGQRPYNSVEFSIMGYEMQFLARHPADCLTAIRQGFSTLPAQYWAERQFLIQFAARLPLAKAPVLDFLASEVNRPMQLGPNGTPDASSYTGVTALNAIMQLTQDQSEIESILVPALKSKTDVRERQALLARYRTLHPDAASTLSLRFVAAGAVAH